MGGPFLLHGVTVALLPADSAKDVHRRIDHDACAIGTEQRFSQDVVGPRCIASACTIAGAAPFSCHRDARHDAVMQNSTARLGPPAQWMAGSVTGELHDSSIRTMIPACRLPPAPLSGRRRAFIKARSGRSVSTVRIMHLGPRACAEIELLHPLTSSVTGARRASGDCRAIHYPRGPSAAEDSVSRPAAVALFASIRSRSSSDRALRDEEIEALAASEHTINTKSPMRSCVSGGRRAVSISPGDGSFPGRRGFSPHYGAEVLHVERAVAMTISGEATPHIVSDEPPACSSPGTKRSTDPQFTAPRRAAALKARETRLYAARTSTAASGNLASAEHESFWGRTIVER